MLKNLHKNISMSLSLIIFLISVINFNTVSSFTNKKLTNVEIFTQNHPIATKILKFLTIGAVVGGLGFATYKGTDYLLDKIKPERVTKRKRQNEIQQKIDEIDNKIFCHELGEKFKYEENNEKKERDIPSSEMPSLIESKKNLTKILKQNNVSNKLAVGAGGVAAGVGLFNILKTLANISEDVARVSYVRYSYNNMRQFTQDVAQNFKSPPKPAEKETSIEQFDEIFNDFYGQEEVLKKLKSYFYDIIIAKDQAKFNGEKYSHCDVIYLYGPSGTGKSLIAEKIPKLLLSNDRVFKISSSDVNLGFNLEFKKSVVEQLLGPSTPETKDSPGATRFAKFLKSNPGGVIIFEEYDKFCDKALDEILRGLIDYGTINLNGERVDCSGTTIIITSNEDEISMEGFDPDDLTVERVNLNEGYTRIYHSKSFLNRIKKVKFEKIFAIDYEKIILTHLDRIKTYWKEKADYNIGLFIKEETVRKIAEKIEKRNEGARPIDLWFIPEVQILIASLIKNAVDKNSYMGQTFEIIFDEQTEIIDLLIKSDDSENETLLFDDQIQTDSTETFENASNNASNSDI